MNFDEADDAAKIMLPLKKKGGKKETTPPMMARTAPTIFTSFFNPPLTWQQITTLFLLNVDPVLQDNPQTFIRKLFPPYKASPRHCELQLISVSVTYAARVHTFICVVTRDS